MDNIVRNNNDDLFYIAPENESPAITRDRDLHFAAEDATYGYFMNVLRRENVKAVIALEGRQAQEKLKALAEGYNQNLFEHIRVSQELARRSLLNLEYAQDIAAMINTIYQIFKKDMESRYNKGTN